MKGVGFFLEYRKKFRGDIFQFADMMPALHNYVTVDPASFIGNPKYMEIIYNMCKTVSVKARYSTVLSEL